MNPDQVYKLFATKRTQVEMIMDRGYYPSDDEIALYIDNPSLVSYFQDPKGNAHLLSEVLRAFIQTGINEKGVFAREQLSQTYSNDMGESIYVYYAPRTAKATQGIAVVVDFVNIAQRSQRAIIISDKGFTPDANKKLDSITDPIIQVFFDYQLYSNPVAHYFVPKHTLLSREEKRKFFSVPKGHKKPPVERSQVPSISIDDPIVRYYGWLPGDLIRVDRTNLVTSKALVQNSVVYRMVNRIPFSAAKKITTKTVK